MNSEQLSFEALGKEVREPSSRIDTFPAPRGVSRVKLICHEVTSLCPVTGQPDFATITIKYIPDQLCVETKSLKLYLWSFRNRGIFCESLASQIRLQLEEALRPITIDVEAEFTSRGGIVIISGSES